MFFRTSLLSLVYLLKLAYYLKYFWKIQNSFFLVLYMYLLSFLCCYNLLILQMIYDILIPFSLILLLLNLFQKDYHQMEIQNLLNSLNNFLYILLIYLIQLFLYLLDILMVYFYFGLFHFELFHHIPFHIQLFLTT